MRFAKIIEAVYNRPWLITPETHTAIRRIVESRLLAADTKRIEDDGLFSMFVNKRPDTAIDDNGIAVISVHGVIGKNLSKIERACGAIGVEQIRAEIQESEESGALGILFHFDSPGGGVTGVPELADLIANISVPTLAYTEDMIASAAYWLASGTDEIVATRSADVGSIGVYIPWVDRSAYYAGLGYEFDPIKNQDGDLKAIGFAPTLTESQRAYLQDEVDTIFSEFRGHIQSYRDVSADAMRGQTLSSVAMLQANLVDAIVKDFGEAYDRLLAKIK